MAIRKSVVIYFII